MEADLSWLSDDRRHKVIVNPFGRIDFDDDERTHADLREAYYEYASDAVWSVLVGVAKEFWGVTESRHLVDVINQTDTLEDVDEEDKLGQPMVRALFQRDWGDLKLFILPGFRERAFPGPEGRLRFPVLIDEDGAIYESSAKRGHVDFAARYSHYIGAIDFGVSLFRGTSREPRFAFDPAAASLVPIYDQMTQVSLDAQYTNGPWLWKSESIWRRTRTDEFFAAVGGLEYTFFQVFATDADIGVIGEYQYDGRTQISLEELASGARETPAPFTIADNDVFAGLRLSLNDTNSTSILAGASVDLSNGSTFIIAEAERRLGEVWTVSLQARLFESDRKDSALALFEQDDFISLEVSRHF